MSDHCSVLMYHAVYRTERERLALAPEDRPYALPLEEFRYHLESIGNTAETVPAPGDIAGGTIPSGVSVALTFDDGYTDISSVIWPELKKRNLSAAVFISAGKLNSPGFLTRDQVRTLAGEGLVIGSHGFSHRLFSSMSETEGREELKNSKRILEEAAEQEVFLLSLPGGGLPRWLPDAAGEAGYRAVFTSEPGYYTGRGGAVPRIPVRPGMEPAVLEGVIRGTGRMVSGMRRGYRIRTMLRSCIGDGPYFRLYKLLTRKRQ